MIKSPQDDLFRHVEHMQDHHPDIQIQWVACTDSTQKRVTANSVLIADQQQAAVGRRGNHWLSPAGQAISLSYRFCLPVKMAALSGYQLTVALAITACLRNFGCPHQRLLKWPNDLCFKRQKFGGILINLNPTQNHDETEVIIGIGLNWSLTADALAEVKQPICNVPLDNKPDRGVFIDHLLSQIKQSNECFCEHGLAPFLTDWAHQDSLLNCRLMLQQDHQQIHGEYAGLSARGELQIRRKGQILRFGSGEVKVRPWKATQ
ncbi:MAG: biotin--[acetyl-CoA-carboxylase] ligase [Proteobacteria bacterium]|nr:MAG: biotin--[acetyl-CoA-carboxylase] ligase [Pseudomonadota bacterium]